MPGVLIKKIHYAKRNRHMQRKDNMKAEEASFPGGSRVKTPPANAENTGGVGLTPGSGRSPGEAHGHPLQCACLGNPMDRGAWWAAVHGLTKGGTQRVT